MHNRPRILIALSVIVLAQAIDARAAIVTAGSGAGCDHATVQAAVVAASPGDEVRLRMETFVETVTIDKALALRGGYSNCSDGTRLLFAKSTLQAPAAGDAPVVTVAAAQAVSLFGMILTGADHDGDGGGLSVGSDADVVIDQLELTGNAAVAGGGVRVGERATLRTDGGIGATIAGNSALVGGGIYVASGATLDFHTAPAAQMYVQSNTATSSGGGIYHSGSGDVLLANTTLQGNAAGVFGGGLHSGAAVGPSALVLEAVTVADNHAGFAGGGVRLAPNNEAVKTLRLTDSSVVGNSTDGNGAGVNASGAVEVTAVRTSFGANVSEGSGGALHSDGGKVTLRSCSLSENVAGEDGGAAWMRDAALQLRTTSAEALVFEGNSASGAGGAIFHAGGANVHMMSSQPIRFLGNSATDGGAIHLDSQLWISQHAAFIGNQALGGGGAVHVVGGSVYGISGAHGTRRLFDSNTAGGEGGAMLLDDARLELAWVDLGVLGDGLALSNQADGFGGAIAAINGSDAVLYHARIDNNGGGTGAGGIYVDATSSVLLRSPHAAEEAATIVGVPVDPCPVFALAANTYCSSLNLNFANEGSAAAILGALDIAAAEVRGNYDGILVGSGGVLRLENTLVVGNQFNTLKALAGGTIVIEQSTIADNGSNTLHVDNADLAVHRSILWGNAGGLVRSGGGSLSSTCNITQSGELSGLVTDPMFGTAARGDYRLLPGSPALDRCILGTLPVDLDGHPRPQDAFYDAGAFEGASAGEALFADGFEDA